MAHLRCIRLGCQWLPLQSPWGVISRYSWGRFPFGISLGNCCPWEPQQKFWVPWILRGSSFGHNFPFWWMAFCWALGKRPYAHRSLFLWIWVKPVMSCWGNRCATAPWNMFAVELFPDLIMSWHAWIIFKAQLSWVEKHSTKRVQSWIGESCLPPGAADALRMDNKCATGRCCFSGCLQGLWTPR